MEPLIINVCLTGIVPQKADNPYTPITPEEIIADAGKVIKLGATVLHIHARENDGSSTYKKELYAKIIQGIRKLNPGVVICVTTSGRIFTSFSKRSDVLELDAYAKPDFASLFLGSMNFPKKAVVNSPKMIVKLATKMKRYGIHPEWEVFEPGMLHFGKYLVEKGILENPRWINIILGSLGASPATPEIFSLFRSMIPSNYRWAGGGVGRFQLAVNTMAIEYGGHVRVGMEDSFYMDPGKKKLATNPDLVERILTIAKSYDRKIATIEQTRKLLLA
ncbi:3-keto-5-aminohexanoate cleavage protein [Candidatus Gottesmanbacteria bacterium]|nr:3-keto-5-aminohexanoate cleavage protein [Candidatus Gottesmanbacteria bacterium]